MSDGLTLIEKRLLETLLDNGAEPELVKLLITNMSQIEMAVLTMLIQNGKVDMSSELDIMIKAGLLEPVPGK